MAELILLVERPQCCLRRLLVGGSKVWSDREACLGVARGRLGSIRANLCKCHVDSSQLIVHRGWRLAEALVIARHVAVLEVGGARICNYVRAFQEGAASLLTRKQLT